MDTDNEFGMYTTETEIPYKDTGTSIVVECSWDELNSTCEMFEDRVKYLFSFHSRMSPFLSEHQVEYIKNKINRIPKCNLGALALELNPKSFRLIDWCRTMTILVEDDYTFNGDKLFPGIVDVLNKFSQKVNSI